MICPVCKKDGITDLALRCPVCQTDLTILHNLEDIQEKYVENAKHRTVLEGNIVTQKKEKDALIGQWRKRAFRYLAFFLFLPLIYKFCMPKKDTNLEQKAIALSVKDSIQQYEIEKLKTQVADLQQDTMALQATKVKSIKYTLTKGETLAELGIRFFNNKKAGFRIARDNKIVASEYTELPVGKTLIINFREK